MTESGPKQLLPPTFKLERYFAQYEFSPAVKFSLCPSDAEPLSMKELLEMADDECRALWDNLTLCYTESTGHPLLRKEAADLHGVLEEHVLVLCPQEGIYIAMHCLVDMIRRKTGKTTMHAIATFPAYQSLFENLKTAGVSVDNWSADFVQGSGWNLSLAKLRALINKDTRILVVNFPHNPTGFIPDEEMWAEIIKICIEKNIFLFSDEMYRLTSNDGSNPLPSACAVYDNAISLSGMSKTFALPGLRLGWLCTKNAEIMEMMKSFKDYITMCSSAPSEILSIIGLRNRKAIVKRTIEINQKSIKALEEFFSCFPDLFEFHAPKGGTTTFLRLKGRTLQWGGGSAFCKKLIEEAGVLMISGREFDYSDEFVRLGFGRKNIPEALKELKRFIEKNLQ